MDKNFIDSLSFSDKGEVLSDMKPLELTEQELDVVTGGAAAPRNNGICGIKCARTPIE
ncbi:hypothetical protein [Chromobacterium vaccinii]|uniref:hypothetical protein n=1 Tax=Chromobacterium vaccinii TaxID=1108595 RepID=UPI00131A2940|nr:hypothetical protein [Chromobacterium vaccinii]